MGDRVRALRESKYWTQDDLARHADVSRASVQKVERGQLGPRSRLIPEIAKALGVDIAVLVGSDAELDIGADGVEMILEGDSESVAKLEQLDARGRATVRATLIALIDAAFEAMRDHPADPADD